MTAEYVPFADRAASPAEQFRLYLYAAVLHVIERAAAAVGGLDDAFERFPFLVAYNNELVTRGVAGLTPDGARTWWCERLREWEHAATAHLPLYALRRTAQLDDDALLALLTAGLIEEDARVGTLFETLHGVAGQRRVTIGLLDCWYGAQPGGLRRLQELGLLRVLNADAPRVEQAVRVPPVLWDVVRGERPDQIAPGVVRHDRAELPSPDALIVPAAVRQALAAMPGLLDDGDVQALVVRGPHHNGRRTVLGALARELGRDLLEVAGLPSPGDERWQWLGPLATLLHALPAFVLDLAPGETAAIPQLGGYTGPLAVVLGGHGGLIGRGVDRALTLNLQTPDATSRREHWQRGLGTAAGPELDGVADRLRITSGNIHRTAVLARSYAALAGGRTVTAADVQRAARALNRQALDTLAVHVPAGGDWGHLAVGADTRRELAILESRCRQRERLHAAVGPALRSQLNAGVRALFSGPSGTGKTLAARVLAGALGMDLYRIDLSSVVNKYIGETEKNLNQVLARAEELDVILLLDEGDALLTQRTHVQTANDRYANLETNFLLQRLESFEGVLIVTTNAGDRIDSAFHRRMDVLIEFRPPEPAERWAIWQLHLPATHAIPDALLSEVATRCSLTGGDIRNAVLHAALLASEDGGVLGAEHFAAAIQREYRKNGAVSPLRAPAASARPGA